MRRSGAGSSCGRGCAGNLREPNAQVAGFLFAAAKGGNVTAQIFWLKTRARWKERPADLRHWGALGTSEPSDGSDRERLEAMIEQRSAVRRSRLVETGPAAPCTARAQAIVCGTCWRAPDRADPGDRVLVPVMLWLVR